MYKCLYLVRHGQTVFNTQRIIQGRSDSPLTELGCNQARAAATWLREHGVRFDAAFSSLAERACDTTEIIWAGAYTRLRDLRERAFGELEGTDVAALPKPMGDYPAQFGGESQGQLEARISGALTGVMRGESGGVPGRSDKPGESCSVEPRSVDEPESGNVLVVSHGAACKGFAHVWEARAQAQIPDPFPNCEILVFEFDPEGCNGSGSFTLVEAIDPAASLGGAGLAI